MIRPFALRASWPLLLVTWVAFAHVVSFQGLAVWIVGGSVVTVLVVETVALLGSTLIPLAAVAGMTVTVPALAEWIGGNSAGPITRASLMSTAAVGAMTIALRTRYPIAVVPISLMFLSGALGLGAARSTLWLAGLWTVAAGLTLAIVGPYADSHLAHPHRRRPVIAMLVAAGLAAIMVLVIVNPFLQHPWTIPGNGIVMAPVVAADHAAVTPVARPSAVVPSTPPADAADSGSAFTGLLTVLTFALLAVLAVLIIWLLLAGLRRLWASLRWWQLHRQLATGTPAHRAIGAWTWVRLRRARADAALPVHLSPDVAADWARTTADPDVRTVATIASLAAYANRERVLGSDADRAWEAARRAGLPRAPSWRIRWGWAARTPRQAAALSENCCGNAPVLVPPRGDSWHP